MPDSYKLDMGRLDTILCAIYGPSAQMMSFLCDL